ncbi:MAG: mRNA-degrading endonuclease [Chitinivibrionales bacterium]|nr:mRNA-degrading endonuclease [Chitinivibrionales bacterium]MBD3397352.1 mRNA-degrading endonuclease [Chitinivibrionales bacterium]
MPHHVPKKGDFIALTFDPQSGHEQKGRRPALVVSNTLFNQKTGMAVACPLTNTNRRVPFHVAVPDDCILTGFVMADQVKALDYGARRAKFIDKAPQELLDEVLAILDAILY